MHDIVRKNIEAIEETTFLYQLHEQNIFDKSLFQEYIENVGLVNAENTEKEMIVSIIETNDYIIRNALYHFLPDDAHVMKNFPSNFGDCLEQIRIENSRLLRML